MSSHTYKIQMFAPGDRDAININQDQYEEIEQAQRFNSFGLALEEKLDLMLENYAELELELLNMSVQNSIFRGSIGELLNEGRHRVNRRFINILTSFRLYHDQVAHAVSDTYGKTSSIFIDMNLLKNKQYDDNLSYRAIEALRNHVQHSSLPVTSIHFSMEAVDKNPKDSNENNIHIAFNVKPCIGIVDLESNKKFKATVLSELRSIANKSGDIELLPLVRQYVTSIGYIHTSIRNLCKSDLLSAAASVTKYCDLTKEKLGGASDGMAAVKINLDDEFDDHVFLTKKLQDRWQTLQSKNNLIDQIAISFVTSKHD